LESRIHFCRLQAASRLIVCLTLAAVFAITTSNNSLVLAQAPGLPRTDKVVRDGPPSVVGAGTFVSLEGRLSISLPQQSHGFRGLAITTPFGVAKGDSYHWTMKEGSYVIGYADAAQPVEDPETAKKVFNSLREEFKQLASVNHGTVGPEKQIALDNHPGLEQRLELFTGSILQRTYLSSQRLYQTVLVVKTTQKAYEAVAASVLNSFKILSDSEVSARLSESTAKNEPSPLPQQPVAPRASSDAKDDGLHGRVKTVLTESQDLSGTWSVQTRKRSSLENFNDQGNLTRRDAYDYKGNLFDITVYGYIDGNRVSNFNIIRHEYDPPPMISTTPGAAAKKSDPRYVYRIDFKYDDKKRLIEEIMFHNNGDLWLRYVYKYTGNQRERLVYSSDGSLNQRYISILDDKGNELEQTIFEARDGTIRVKHSYAYEFDSIGNWTKRTASKLVIKDGSSQQEPQNIYYRTITYYK
jgi:hypothetical protein